MHSKVSGLVSEIMYLNATVANNGLRLKERVMDLRKAHLEKPWPPNDRDVGVILVAHSMGLVSKCLP